MATGRTGTAASDLLQQLIDGPVNQQTHETAATGTQSDDDDDDANELILGPNAQECDGQHDDISSQKVNEIRQSAPQTGSRPRESENDPVRSTPQEPLASYIVDSDEDIEGLSFGEEDDDELDDYGDERASPMFTRRPPPSKATSSGSRVNNTDDEESRSSVRGRTSRIDDTSRSSGNLLSQPGSSGMGTKKSSASGGRKRKRSVSSTGSSRSRSQQNSNQRKSQKKKNHKCDECGKLLWGSFELKEHVRVEHRGERFVCDVCQRGFTARHTLKRHKDRFHKDGRSSFPCRVDKCRYMADNKDAFIAHAIRKHKHNVLSCLNMEIRKEIALARKKMAQGGGDQAGPAGSSSSSGPRIKQEQDGDDHSSIFDSPPDSPRSVFTMNSSVGRRALGSEAGDFDDTESLMGAAYHRQLAHWAELGRGGPPSVFSDYHRSRASSISSLLRGSRSKKGRKDKGRRPFTGSGHPAKIILNKNRIQSMSRLYNVLPAAIKEKAMISDVILWQCPIEGCKRIFITKEAFESHIVESSSPELYGLGPRSAGSDPGISTEDNGNNSVSGQQPGSSCSNRPPRPLSRASSIGSSLRRYGFPPLIDHSNLFIWDAPHGYKCIFPNCAFRTKAQDESEEHQQRHIAATYTCPDCDKKYPFDHMVVAHRRRVHSSNLTTAAVAAANQEHEEQLKSQTPQPQFRPKFVIANSDNQRTSSSPTPSTCQSISSDKPLRLTILPQPTSGTNTIARPTPIRLQAAPVQTLPSGQRIIAIPASQAARLGTTGGLARIGSPAPSNQQSAHTAEKDGSKDMDDYEIEMPQDDGEDEGDHEEQGPENDDQYEGPLDERDDDEEEEDDLEEDQEQEQENEDERPRQIIKSEPQQVQHNPATVHNYVPRPPLPQPVTSGIRPPVNFTPIGRIVTLADGRKMIQIGNGPTSRLIPIGQPVSGANILTMPRIIGTTAATGQPQPRFITMAPLSSINQPRMLTFTDPHSKQIRVVRAISAQPNLPSQSQPQPTQIPQPQTPTQPQPQPRSPSPSESSSSSRSPSPPRSTPSSTFTPETLSTVRESSGQPNRCPIAKCGMIFETVDKLEHHIIECQDEEMSPSPAIREIHRLLYTAETRPGGNTVYKCVFPRCPFATTSLLEIDGHQEQHLGFTYACPQCDKKYPFQHLVQAHRALVHSYKSSKNRRPKRHPDAESSLIPMPARKSQFPVVNIQSRVSDPPPSSQQQQQAINFLPAAPKVVRPQEVLADLPLSSPRPSHYGDDEDEEEDEEEDQDEQPQQQQQQVEGDELDEEGEQAAEDEEQYDDEEYEDEEAEYDEDEDDYEYDDEEDEDDEQEGYIDQLPQFLIEKDGIKYRVELIAEEVTDEEAEDEEAEYDEEYDEEEDDYEDGEYEDGEGDMELDEDQEEDDDDDDEEYQHQPLPQQHYLQLEVVPASDYEDEEDEDEYEDEEGEDDADGQDSNGAEEGEYEEQENGEEGEFSGEEYDSHAEEMEAITRPASEAVQIKKEIFEREEAGAHEDEDPETQRQSALNEHDYGEIEVNEDGELSGIFDASDLEDSDYQEEPLPPQIYTCPLSGCGRSFRSREDFETHLADALSEDCPSPLVRELHKSWFIHDHRSGNYRCIMPSCDFKTRSLLEIEGHQEMHTANRYACPQCEKVFPFEHMVASHRRHIHAPPRSTRSRSVRGPGSTIDGSEYGDDLASELKAKVKRPNEIEVTVVDNPFEPLTVLTEGEGGPSEGENERPVMIATEMSRQEVIYHQLTNPPQPMSPEPPPYSPIPHAHPKRQSDEGASMAGGTNADPSIMADDEASHLSWTSEMTSGTAAMTLDGKESSEPLRDKSNLRNKSGVSTVLASSVRRYDKISVLSNGLKVSKFGPHPQKSSHAKGVSGAVANGSKTSIHPDNGAAPVESTVEDYEIFKRAERSIRERDLPEDEEENLKEVLKALGQDVDEEEYDYEDDEEYEHGYPYGAEYGQRGSSSLEEEPNGIEGEANDPDNLHLDLRERLEQEKQRQEEEGSIRSPSPNSSISYIGSDSCDDLVSDDDDEMRELNEDCVSSESSGVISDSEVESGLDEYDEAPFRHESPPASPHESSSIRDSPESPSPSPSPPASPSQSSPSSSSSGASSIASPPYVPC